MGILAVDSIKSRTVAPVTVSDDLNVTGVSTVGVLTATSVVVGSAVTVNADGVITSGIVTATTFQGNFNGTTGTFSGDVSIGGTLTYEDVERVDATGLSTFREGLNVGSPTGVGGTFNPQGDISAGIITANSYNSTGNITAVNTASGGQSVTLKVGASNASGVNNGNIVINNGGTGNASLQFDYESNTERAKIYVYRSTQDLIFDTAGSERLRIAATGEIGIGTNNPEDYEANGNNLVVGDTTSHNGITILTGTDKDGRLGFADGTGAASYRGMIEYQHGTGTAEFMKIGVAGAERLRITSAGGLTFSNGELIEKCYINSTAWSTTGTVNLDNGMVQYNSSNLAGTTNTLDIISSAGINTSMATGDMMAVTCMTAVNASTAYVNNITIDGIAATETWVGGSAPTDGGTSGVDIYAFNIVKTADATFLVVANQTKTS